MAKDSFWFKHDSTAGRGGRLRKIQFIHGHWGKGIYWDVIEYLREQDGYKSKTDDFSLRLICDIIGCKDESKFLSWFRDCVKENLLIIDGDFFYSERLLENMNGWELSKSNGKKGGNPNFKKGESNPYYNKDNPGNKGIDNPVYKGDHKHKIREDKIREEIKEAFNSFRVLYPGTKNGNETELENFQKKHKDWANVLPSLKKIIEGQINLRAEKIKRGMFVPEWKNLKTWINGRCWEEEVTPFVVLPINSAPIISSNSFFKVDE